MRTPRSEALAVAAVLLAVLGLALWVRLPAVPAASLGSDGLGPYLVALSVWQGGGWPHPPNPEGGHSLWLLQLPLLPFSRSLEALVALRFCVGALVAPLAAGAAAVLASAGRRAAAAAAAGVWLAVDPGLVDTLTSAFRGYGAPELLAAVTLCAAVWLRRPTATAPLAAAAVLFVAATGQHPFATGTGMGALLALAALAPERRVVLWALGAGLVACLPRLHHLLWLSGCGDGTVACLARVATGSAEPDTPILAMVRRAFHDRILVEGWWPWPVAGLGLGLLAIRSVHPRRVLLWWALGGLGGILVMGLLAQSLRPYHLRMAMPGLAVGAAVGLSRLPGASWLLVASSLLLLQPPPPAEEWGPSGVDAVTASLLEPGDPPVGLQAAWWDHPAGLDPTAVALSAWLQGRSAPLTTDPAAPVILLAHDVHFPSIEHLPPGSGWLETSGRRPLLLRFASAGALEDWLEEYPPVHEAGPAEWAGHLNR